MVLIIELDDGKILTGKPDQFDGKNPWVSCKFSQQNQSSELMISAAQPSKMGLSENRVYSQL